MRVLVTGAAGMLGRDVVAAAEAAGHEVAGLGRAELDICDEAGVAEALTRLAPHAVVNCAAWTDVDRAEAEEADATRINGDGPGVLARACRDRGGALLVHVSTDYVFDGAARAEPYVESDPTGPLSAYGRSKLAGERAIAGTPGARAAIVRTSWVFGPHGGNFVATMLRLGGERDEVHVVDDQVGCPTYTGHLAQALVAVADRGLTGVLHVAGGGACSWHGLAQRIFERAGMGHVRVHRASSADLDRPAPRPAFSVLGTQRADTPRLPAWEAGLDAYLASLEVLST